MKVRSIRKGLVLLGALSTLALGCELIVDFDRTKIPAEVADTGLPDGTAGDATSDAPVDAPADVTADADAATTDAADADAGDADLDADADQ